MQLIPRELLYEIVSYLRPPDYVNLATADRYVSRTINEHFKETYSEVILSNDYRCCGSANTVCTKCQYIYCYNHCMECYICEADLCPDCDQKSDCGCYKCTFDAIINGDIV